ncbi:MAG: hypothetical protein DMF52_06820 [Acidobacteria bacterium]|nr:MAG: hypothetical protein DMF52_06820 [Acidobacteriota bacterium]
MPKVPGWYKEQKRNYPEVFRAYEDLGEVCRKAGPLDGKTATLVKLGIAVGTRHEGAVHSHTRRSLEAAVGVRGRRLSRAEPCRFRRGTAGTASPRGQHIAARHSAPDPGSEGDSNRTHHPSTPVH